MPELPEVETVRRGLQQNVVGRLVVKVEVGRERTVRRGRRFEGENALEAVAACLPEALDRVAKIGNRQLFHPAQRKAATR